MEDTVSTSAAEDAIGIGGEIKPVYMQFVEDGKVVGKLLWDGGVFRFEGNAEESAKLFLAWLNKLGVR